MEFKWKWIEENKDKYMEASYLYHLSQDFVIRPNRSSGIKALIEWLDGLGLSETETRRFEVYIFKMKSLFFKERRQKKIESRYAKSICHLGLSETAQGSNEIARMSLERSEPKIGSPIQKETV